MASYFGISGNVANSFFNASLGNKGSGDTSNVLNDYALIQSGAYKKLVVATQKKRNEETDKQVKEETKSLEISKTDAKALKTASETLSSTKFTEENRDEILKNVKAFVGAYNDTLKSAGNVDTQSVLKKGVFVTQTTNANVNTLKKLGITVGKENQLVIDEDALKKARLTDLETMFGKSSSSYVNQIGKKASQIFNLASNAIENKSATLPYGRNGEYKNMNTNSMFEGLI